MREVYEDIAIIVRNFFEKHGYDKTLNLVLRSETIIKNFNALYCFFLKDGIAPLETLEVVKKRLFWDVTKDFFTDKGKRVEAARALYVLDLITENN